MNIDKPGEEQVIDENFHGECHEHVSQVLVADDISDPNLNIDIPNMEGGRQDAGQ